jgi:alpha-beta hydrolase superfamily lysophospholipase
VLATLALAASLAVASPPSLATKCGSGAVDGVRAQPFWLTTSDRVRLYAMEAGRGEVGVVLAHESPADLCGWLPYVPSLTRAGFRVLAFDFRAFGSSQRPPSNAFYRYDRDLSAAIARARADGARKVVLMGGSFGGATVLADAWQLDADAVISLSGEARLPGSHIDGLRGVRRLHAPLLIVGSRHDRYLSVEDALRLLRTAASKDKRTALYPSSYHGWDIVESAPYAGKARALILRWIRDRT